MSRFGLTLSGAVLLAIGGIYLMGSLNAVGAFVEAGLPKTAVRLLSLEQLLDRGVSIVTEIQVIFLVLFGVGQVVIIELIVVRPSSNRRLGYGSEKAMRRGMLRGAWQLFTITVVLLLICPWKASVAFIPLLAPSIALWINAQRGGVASRVMSITLGCALTASLLLSAYLIPIPQPRAELFLKSGSVETGVFVTNISDTWYIGDNNGGVQAIPISTVESGDLTYNENGGAGNSPMRIFLKEVF